MLNAVHYCTGVVVSAVIPVVVKAEIVTAVKTVAVVGVMVLVLTVVTVAVVYCIYQGKITNWAKRPTALGAYISRDPQSPRFTVWQLVYSYMISCNFV